MADYTLNKTGQQIDTILGKADKLPAVSASDSGKTLQVDVSGNIVANNASGGGTQLYKHELSDEFDSVFLTIISLRSNPYTNVSNENIDDILNDKTKIKLYGFIGDAVVVGGAICELIPPLGEGEPLPTETIDFSNFDHDTVTAL